MRRGGRGEGGVEGRGCGNRGGREMGSLVSRSSCVLPFFSLAAAASINQQPVGQE
jgi:hypothetical protein